MMDSNEEQATINVENSLPSSSIISAYIHRFRYSRPTAPEERSLPTKKNAFWWLSEDDLSTKDNQFDNTNDNNIHNLTTHSEDSLDLRDSSKLPKKVDQQSTHGLIFSDESPRSSTNHSIFSHSSMTSDNMPNLQQSIDTSASSVVDLRSHDSVPAAYYQYRTPRLVGHPNYDPDNGYYKKGISEYEDHSYNTRKAHNHNDDDEDEEKLDIPTAEEELEMDEHMKQILRQCNKLVKTLKEDTERLQTTRATTTTTKRKEVEEEDRADSPPPPPPPPLHTRPLSHPSYPQKTEKFSAKKASNPLIKPFSYATNPPTASNNTNIHAQTKSSEKPPGVAEALSLVQRILRETNNMDLLSVRESTESYDNEEEEDEDEMQETADEDKEEEEEEGDETSTMEHSEYQSHRNTKKIDGAGRLSSMNQQQQGSQQGSEEEVLSSLESSIFDRYFHSTQQPIEHDNNKPNQPSTKEKNVQSTHHPETTQQKPLLSPPRKDMYPPITAAITSSPTPPSSISLLSPSRPQHSDNHPGFSPMISQSPIRPIISSIQTESPKRDEEASTRYSQQSSAQSPSILYLSSDDEDDMISDLIKYLPAQSSPMITSQPSRRTEVNSDGVAFSTLSPAEGGNITRIQPREEILPLKVDNNIQKKENHMTINGGLKEEQKIEWDKNNSNKHVTIDHTFVQEYLQDEIVAQLWSRLVEIRKAMQKEDRK